jgi:drug/metabolite transporter (DMT)-like permease
MKALTGADNAKGLVYATGAAALNGTIAISSKYLIGAGLPASSIAFLRSIIGVALLLVLVRAKRETLSAFGRAAVCAFFGIFVLFFFETNAYRSETAANVVLTLMAVAALSAFLLGWILLGDKPTLSRWLGLSICVVGLAVFLGAAKPTNILGLTYAAIAGAGYGAFTVSAKRLNIGSGLAITRLLLLCGSAYLAIPFVTNGAVFPTGSWPVWTGLVALALFPSIGGFYCTTRAIELASPAQIQLFELSEPLFAGSFAVLFLHEIPAVHTYVGGALVLCGLYIAQKTWGTPALIPT